MEADATLYNNDHLHLEPRATGLLVLMMKKDEYILLFCP